MNLGSFRILLPFFRTSWGVGVLNSAIFKLIRMLEWNTKHFPLNLQSDLTFVKLSGCRGGFELWNQIRHCKTVCIKRNLYLINYNRMRTQWTIKGNRDAGSSCLCDRGLHRYLRNFGGRGGFEHPKPPLGTPLPMVEASRSHSDTPHSVGIPWTSDRPVARTSTRQHTTLTRDRRSCTRRDSNPNPNKRAADNQYCRPRSLWIQHALK